MAEQPVVISATIVDKDGIEASAPAYAQADDTKTLAALVTEANAYWTALDAVTDGFIRKVRIELVPPLPGGLKGAAVATGAPVEKNALLGFSASGTTKRYSLDIPAVSDSVESGNRLTLGSGALPTLIAILTTVGTVLKWCNDHNQQIANFVDALIAYRKKRKQQQRSSFEVAP